MTDNRDGLDAIERRFERRPRSVPPPRRPRNQAKTSSNGSTESEQAMQGDPSSAEPQTTVESPADQRPPEVPQSSSEEQPPTESQESRDEAPVAAEAAAQVQEADGGHQEQPGDRSGEQGQAEAQPSEPATPMVQGQLAEALAPVMSDLQRQIAEAVQRQVKAQISEMRRQGVQEQEGQHVTEKEAQHVQEAASVQETGQEEVTHNVEPTPQAEQEAGEKSESPAQGPFASVRQTMSRMLGALVRAVKQLLRSVARRLRAMVRGLGEAFRSLASLIGRAFSWLWNGIKSLPRLLLQKIVLAILRALLRSLLHSLMRWLGDSGAPPSAEAESPEDAPGKAA